MTKNKDENDENKEDDKRSKRGRPPLKSSLQTNMTCGLPKSPTSEGKSSSKSMRNSLSDSSSLSNGLEGSARRRTRRSSGLYDSDRFSNDSSTSESESDETSEKASVKEEDEALPAEEPENIFSRVEISPVKEEPPVICVSKDPEHGPTKPAETLNQEVDESEQIVPIYGKQTEPLEEIKEAEHLPNSKGRRSKTKDPSLEDTECLSATQEDTMAEPHVEEETLDLPSLSPLQSKELPIPQREAELPADQLAQEKKGMKRKALEPSSPDKKLRADCDPELPIIVAQEKPAENNEAQERSNAVDEEEELPNVNEEMPSLTAELEHVQSTRTDELDVPLNEITNVPYREDQDTMMPTIGPENLLCHEVDLGDFDEKDKVEDLVMDKVELDAQTILPPTQPHNYSVASPLALSHDESHSIKSESDITIEVDSVAEESQECLCESESANGFEASTTSSNCSVTAQEAEMPEKGHKRMNEGLSGTLAKKQKRTPKRISASSKAEKNGIGQSSDSEDLSTLDSSKCTPIKHPGVPKTHKIIRSPARITSPHNKDGEKEKHREKHHPHTSPRAYKWTLQLSELDNMSGTEKIIFLQEKLQEMRKYYMSLKSEVATIDRRRKRLKKKDREVSNTGASMSSGSSETGMSPSSASPPQNAVALECR
ncbi:hypothetical protein XELAEV_18041119mg [Xenopus laevis]|uniref:AT-rich interactive domain-containing protein 4A n=1 Tax=Xenopus laevis TaxID=8355 RepID=A0A974C1J5_XENLA|nr:hypothetical protein XELAEV_18041119mg [Xenopus laevis]